MGSDRRSSSREHVSEVRAAPHKLQTRKKSHGMIDDPDNVFFYSNVNSSGHEALLYVFEDNEAAIKMIIKGRFLDV